MHEVIDRLYVGDDDAYQRLKDKPGWKFVRACKEGPGGHRETLGYTTHAAPKGPEYLAAEKDNRLALNFIDPHDPHYIPVAMIQQGLKYIRQALADGSKVLVACNRGHSRGPTTALLFLRSIGEMDGNFHSSENKFKTLYPDYDPGIGARQFARTHWSTFHP